MYGDRRNFFIGAASFGAAIGFSLGTEPRLARAQAPVVLGAGTHRYEWVSSWGPLPGSADYGNTHGAIVIDEAERVYLNTDTTQAVLMFDLEGRFIGSWGKEFAGGLHGMALVRECGGEELLYLTHTERHEVVKARLDGSVTRITAACVPTASLRTPVRIAPRNPPKQKR